MNFESIIQKVYITLTERDPSECGVQPIYTTLTSIRNRHLRGTFRGPVGTPYNGGVFDVDITLPERYPLEPPKMRFVTKVWHPNVCSDTGAICDHNHYHYYYRRQNQDIRTNDKCADSYNLKGNLSFLVVYLFSTIPESYKQPLNVEAAQMFKTDPDGYDRTAKLWTDRYARETSWEDVWARNHVDGIFADVEGLGLINSATVVVRAREEKGSFDDGSGSRISMDATQRNQTNLKRKLYSDTTTTATDNSATDSIEKSIDQELPTSSPSYHWVGDGKTTTFIAKSLDTRTATHYPALELCNMEYNQKNTLITVRIGDTVLLRRTMSKDGSSSSSSGPLTPTPFRETSSKNGQPSTATTTTTTTASCSVSIEHKGMHGGDHAPTDAAALEEEDDTLNSTLESASRTEVSMETIDPLVGKVEDMFEEEDLNDVDTKHSCYPKPIYKITKRQHTASPSANSNHCGGGGLKCDYEAFDRSGRPRYLQPMEENGAQFIDQNVVRLPHIFINAMGTIPSKGERCRHVLIDDDRRKKMKIRIRWFLKKEDVESLEGKFIGVSSREDLLLTMTPRDLLLNDQIDVLDVSRILTKCLVVGNRSSFPPVATGTTSVTTPMKLASTKGTSNLTLAVLSSRSATPKETSGGGGNAAQNRRRLAAFSCLHNISIKPAIKGSPGQSSVILSPYVSNSGNEDDWNGGAFLSFPSSQNEDHLKKRARITPLIDENNGGDSEEKVSIPSVSKENALQDKATIAVTHEEKKLVFKMKGGNGVSSEMEGHINGTDDDKIIPNSHSIDGPKNDLPANEISSKNIDGDVDRDNSIGTLAEEVRQALSNKKQQSALPLRAISDGTITTVGKIKVGTAYQAIIPHVVKRRKYTSSCPAAVAPELVWKPNAISDVDLDSFILEAGKVLKKLADKNRLQLTMMEHRLVLMGRSEEEVNANFTSSSFRAVEYREFNKEAILALLHKHRYDMSSALDSLSKAPPEKYLTLWTKEEQELYNAGFHTYLSSLLQISKGIHSKSHKDVIDYHYRFKIPDQFRKYQSKKLEQAKRMMRCIERRRSDEVMKRLYGPLNDSQVANSSGSNNGLKKNHEWTTTGGGGQDAIGATEHRRLNAKDLLLLIQKEAGDKKYRMIVEFLKNFQLRSITALQLKQGFTNELEMHPALLEQFQSFLPQPLRNRKTE